LRAEVFRGVPVAGADADGFDARAEHVLVEDTRTGRLVCCFRLLRFGSGAEIAASYSAQFYDLAGLARQPGPMLEMGRFCVAPGAAGADVLRVAWGALADHIDAHRIAFVFGCSSFAGTEAERYPDAFALLGERHLAPGRWLPRVKAPDVFGFARHPRPRRPDLRAATLAMPPLLRTYLAMGGRVSDHAVIDRDLGTLHVFTGLEIGAVPARRAHLLRGRAV
jgi:putative hemolysin